jgi:hypothetical protein
VLEIGQGHATTIFRIVRSDNVDDPVLLNSFKSNYELGEEPRKVERSSTVVHMGLSAYLEEGVAHGTSQKWEKLGDFVAVLRLRPDQGFNFAHTGHPLHLTVWGDPVKLRDAVVDIQPVWT